MSFDKWSVSEKKIARRVFDAALEREFATLMNRLREMAVQLATSADTWDMHHFLSANCMTSNGNMTIATPGSSLYSVV